MVGFAERGVLVERKRKTKGKRSSQFGKRQSLRESVLVFRSERKKEKLRRENKIVFGERLLRKAGSCVEGANGGFIKRFGVWKTVALEA